MWLDRITGEKLKTLPDDIVPSRYIACDAFDINARRTLNPGELLVDDGSSRLLDGRREIKFHTVEYDQEAVVQHDVVIDALMEFQSAELGGRNRSFLLPEELLSWLHLQPLDLSIHEVMQKGHFHEIDSSPKMDLVYQEHLLPVGRVKKVPSSATKYLAAHSECWQKRSFSGVIPKTLLALESEDEYNIYENRVFARLLDHLERYLQRRCNEVSLIEKTIKESARFEGAEVYWEAGRAIYSLWGEGFSANDDLDEEEIEGSATLQALRSLLKQIRGLQKSRLYKAIPRNDEVGFRIRMTNALTHDQHYRHVARLWHQWSEYSKSGKLDPEVIFDNNTTYSKAYILYVKALVFRALEELGYSNKDDGFYLLGRASIEVSDESYNLLLKLGGSSMKIVSVFGPLPDDVTTQISKNEQVIVITPEASGFSLCESSQGASPLYFYTLEAMVTRLSTWIALQAAEIMTRKLERLPNKVRDMMLQEYKDNFKVEKYTAMLRAPLGEKIEHIKHKLKTFKQDASVNQFVPQLEKYSNEIDALLICPLCGKAANFNNYAPRDTGCFEIKGTECDHVWKIDKDNSSKRFFVAEPATVDETLLSEVDEFKKYGRYKWACELPILS